MKKCFAVVLALGLFAGVQARQNHSVGYRREKMDWSHLGPRPTTSSTVPLLKRSSLSGNIEKEEYPVRFDLRDEGLVTPVKDQGVYGSCWAFAACGSLESYMLRTYGVEFDFSERNMVLARGVDADPDLDEHGFGLLDEGGETSIADGYLIGWKGPVLESADPYPSTTTPALEALAEKYRDFFTNRVAKIEVVVGMYFYENADVTLEFLSGLGLMDWTLIDREASLAGYGLNFRTNFVHAVRITDRDGKRVSVPHLNRELIPDEVFPDCEGRQGPWDVTYHVQGNWRLPPRSSPLDNQTYKYALMKHGAVSVGYCHDDDCRLVQTIDGKETVTSYCADKDAGPNHQVLMVGWDDEFPASAFGTENHPAGDGAFLLRNNWGQEDEAGGYFWVSYYDTSLACAEGDTASVYTRVDDAFSPENYDSIVGYDELGLGHSVGIGKTSATAASIHTAKEAISLRAVGTYLVQWNTKYTVKIYTGCTAGKPTSGVLAHTQSGTREFPGFETIDLTREVPVAAGERYSVVITYTTPGFTRPIPVQVDDTDDLRFTRKGRSYMKKADGSWSDLASYNAKKALSLSNCPKAHCCKVYFDGRVPVAFDGDAKNVFSTELADGSTLTVTIGAASNGRCAVSAKIVKVVKTIATYAARTVTTSDGFVILKSSSGKDLWINLSGTEESGNAISATLNGAEVSDFKSLNPNLQGFDAGDFRVGVAAVGTPVFVNDTGKTLTWSARNLPAGVTINAKTGKLTGAPTAVVKTKKTARITVTATGGGSDSYSIAYTVDPIHAWALGTKNGGGEDSSFTFTVGKTGKVSGKLYLGNTNWTFSANCLTSYAESETNYLFSCKAVSGVARLPIDVMLSPSVLTNCTSDIPTIKLGVARGTTEAGDQFVAWENVWGKAPYSYYAKVLVNAPAMTFKYGDLSSLKESERLVLKFSKSGSVICSGVFNGVKNRKATAYKPTRTIPLLPLSTLDDGSFRAAVYPWFAPSTTYKFAGYFDEINLLWDNFRFVQE